MKTENGFRASVLSTGLVHNDGTQLTMMVLEHGKPMPDGFINPGLDHRDRVLVGLAVNAMLAALSIITNLGLLEASAGEDCSSSFSIEFDELASWSVVLIHESPEASLDNGGQVETLGVVELAYRERAEDEPNLGPHRDRLAGRLLCPGGGIDCS